MDKTIKALKKVFSNQYELIVSQLHSKKITEEDVATYVANFPVWLKVLEEAKENKARQEHEQRYKETISTEQTVADKLKEEAQNELTLLIEELDMTEKGYAFEPAKRITKFNKMRRISKKIEQAERTIAMLDELGKEYAPPKRPVGRPRKEKQDEEKL